jgi:hypothetical protein
MTADDVYDDPDNVLADSDDSVNGSVELPGGDEADLSQTPYLPEKDTGIEGEDRGDIDELGARNDPESTDDSDAVGGAAAEDSHDPDASRLGLEVAPDERDGTDPV